MSPLSDAFVDGVHRFHEDELPSCPQPDPAHSTERTAGGSYEKTPEADTTAGELATVTRTESPAPSPSGTMQERAESLRRMTFMH